VQGLDYYKVTYGLKITENWITHNYLFSYIITLVNAWCVLTLLCVKRQESMNRVLEFQPFVFLGKLSYGVYVLHLPILGFVAYINYYLLKGKNLQPYILHEFILFGVYFITVMAIAYLSFTYFESYFLRMKKKLKRTPALHEQTV
jgi:peptidoglycan/LPS O-acetylase OafA/YrhL